jgi:hypothetical protein
MYLSVLSNHGTITTRLFMRLFDIDYSRLTIIIYSVSSGIASDYSAFFFYPVLITTQSLNVNGPLAGWTRSLESPHCNYRIFRLSTIAYALFNLWLF